MGSEMCIRDRRERERERERESRSITFILVSSILLYVHRDHKDQQGRGAQDGHLDLHTAPEP